MKYILVIAFTCCQLLSSGQKVYSTITDIANIKEIIFYGYDFSNFKLADPKRFNDARIKNYLPAWIAYLNKDMDERYFARKLKKSKVIFDFDYTGKVIQEKDALQLVSLTRHAIAPDSIKSIIDQYKISQKEGIGFSVIIECFDNDRNEISAYFTFFDIATKKIILSDRFSTNNPSGMGLTKFWGSGLYSTVDVYISAEYKYRLKGK